MYKILTLLIVIGLQWGSAQNESHLNNIKQLTYGGDNAEAYFSSDGKKLVFQSNNMRWNVLCDQIFCMNINAAASDTNYKPMQICHFSNFFNFTLINIFRLFAKGYVGSNGIVA